MKLKLIVSILLLGMTLQLSGCVALLAGGAAAGGYYIGKDPRTVGEIADDAAITAKIKTRLFEAKDIKSLNIGVDTFLRTVTLKGRVRSAHQEERAVKIAEGVPGVKKVISKLNIVPIPASDRSS